MSPPYRREQEWELGPQKLLLAGMELFLFCQAELTLLNDHLRFTQPTRVKQGVAVPGTL